MCRSWRDDVVATRSAGTPPASTAIVSVPRGGRGTSRPKILRCRRVASTDGLARRPCLTRIRKQIRITRATRLGDFDRAGANAAVKPWDIGHVAVGVSLMY